jgi:hypothetical protein
MLLTTDPSVCIDGLGIILAWNHVHQIQVGQPEEKLLTQVFR